MNFDLSVWVRRAALLFALSGWLVPSLAADAGLLELVLRAKENDPDFRAATASRDAGLQSRNLARAYLLPTLSGYLEKGHSGTNRDYNNGAAPLKYSASSITRSINLNQPLINPQNLASWREEDSRAVLAELRFHEAEVEITLKTLRAVFDVHLAQDSADLAKAQFETLTSQMRDAEGLRQVGMLTKTEVEDTRTKLMQAKAGMLEAEYALQLRRRELSKLVGASAPEMPSRAIRKDVAPISPDDLQAWIEFVEAANPKALSAKANFELASLTTTRVQAGHLPSLDLLASSTKTRNPNNFTDLENSSSVAVRLTVPIYQGGRTSASLDKAVAMQEQAREEWRGATEDAKLKATEAFWGTRNSREKIKAYEQALGAAEIALLGASLARQVGQRTTTDVLNATQQVYSVKRDLNKERYTLIFATLNLRALAGQLDESMIRALDAPTK